MISTKIKGRDYLDFNATSPYSRSVVEYLINDEYFLGNPSSIHTTGKKSKRAIRECSDYLNQLYKIPENFQIFFHSGATEGINTVLFGVAKVAFLDKKVINFFFSRIDHACVVNQKDELEMLGHNVFMYDVDKNGDVDSSKLISQINSSEGESILNVTWVNNETGVCFDLELVKKIKEQTHCLVHVDAVQSVGKIANWKELSFELDAYTFSGHKFGSLKGIGYTVIKRTFPFRALLRGGGQQMDLRSGTENPDSIHSLKLALKDVEEDFNVESLNKAKSYIEQEIIKLTNDKVEIVGINAKQRNLNTIFIIFPKQTSDNSMREFDLAGIDVSAGSACSSGTVKPSSILLAMGKSEIFAKSGIRISLPYNFDFFQARNLLAPLLVVVKKLI